MGLFDKLKAVIAGAQSAPAETLADQAPGSVELYASSIASLLQSESHSFITIQDSGEACVQVAKGGDELSLNIASYPFADGPQTKLGELGIALPEGSMLQDWDAECYCQFGVPVGEADALAATIDTVFRGLYEKTDGYTVSVYMEA